MLMATFNRSSLIVSKYGRKDKNKVVIPDNQEQNK